MRILIGDKGNVDFDDPIPMSKEQRNDFLNFMSTLFCPIKIEDNRAFRIKRLGDQIFQRKWDDKEEIAMLLDLTIDTNELSTKLGRTWMSVNIKRGQIIPDLMKWADSKNYDLTKGDLKNIIEEYLQEKKEIGKLNRKASRDKKNKIKKEMDDIRIKIGNCRTMINSIEIRINANMAFPSDSNNITINKEKIKNLELDYYSKATELDPDNDEYWNDKGDALYNLERYDEALNSYNKAIDLNPDYSLYWINKAAALFSLEKIDDSINCYDKALDIDPTDESAWFCSASIFSLLGNKEEALFRLAKSIELDNSNKNTAKVDTDFESLWDDSKFQELVK